MAATNKLSTETSSTKSCLERKRKENLTDDQVTALINIWEEFLPELRSQKRNARVYLKIVAALKDQGVHRNATDVKNKIHNLTKEYRRERRKLCAGCSPSTWKFYNAVHRVIGGIPVYDNTRIRECFSVPPEPYEVLVQDMEIFPAAVESSFIDGGSNTSSNISREMPVPIEENGFQGNSIYTESSADDTCSSEISSGAKRRRVSCSVTTTDRETSIFEAMLHEQKRSNARTEAAMAKAEELDTRAVAMLEEYNSILRQSLEVQKAMLQMFADFKK